MKRIMLLTIASLFWFEQNRYFGWNAFPRSDAELMTDGISLLLFALMWVAE